MNFFDRLHDRIRTVDSVVSVGLDPDQSRIPDHLHEHDLPRWAFNRRIIDATHEHAAVFKPNAAFYEDPDGWRALEETVAYAHGKGVPVLLDAKRADIGNTTRQYARLLETVDAITVNPYMGRDSLQPFLANEEAGVFVLCRTSNPGGADLQDLELETGESVYERVAALADLWNENDNVGLVVGATQPEELEDLREQVPDLPSSSPESGHRAATPKRRSSTGWPTASDWSTPRAESFSPARVVVKSSLLPAGKPRSDSKSGSISTETSSSPSISRRVLVRRLLAGVLPVVRIGIDYSPRDPTADHSSDDFHRDWLRRRPPRVRPTPRRRRCPSDSSRSGGRRRGFRRAPRVGADTSRRRRVTRRAGRVSRSRDCCLRFRRSGQSWLISTSSFPGSAVPARRSRHTTPCCPRSEPHTRASRSWNTAPGPDVIHRSDRDH